MIFFNDRKLARLIRDGQLSERGQLPYFIALMLYVGILGSNHYVAFMADPPAPPTLYEHILDVSWLAASLLSLLWCYRVNERGDGRAFIARYVCLGFPVMMTAMLVGLVFGVAGGFIDNPGFLSGGEDAMVAGPAACAGLSLATAYMLWRLPGAMKVAASGRAAASGARPWGAVAAGSPHGPAAAPGIGAPGLRPMLLNVRHGLGAALMSDTAPARMYFSWSALVFVLGLYLLLANIFDYHYAAAPRAFNSYAFAAECARLMVLLLGAYGACVVFLRDDRTLAFMVALCNTLLLPWFLLTLLLTGGADWTEDGDNREGLIMIAALWIYIAAFRLLTAFFGPQPLRAALAAGVVIVALAVPHNYFYLPAFWYEAEVETEDPPRDNGPTALDRQSHEALFARQPAMIESALAHVPASALGITNIYAVIFGGYAQENVFRREVAFVEDTLARTYGLQGYIVPLLNHEFTVDRIPLATAANLEATLRGLSARMQPEDILLLYMTSHGDPEAGLSVTLDGNLRFDRVDGPRIRRALDASGIENRVIILSACHSGSMIGALRTDASLIMTAAAADRRSFGCSDTAELTYFADALFRHALPAEPDLIKAFWLAEAHIRQREKDEGIEEASLPQIHVGPAIEAALRRYRPPPAPAIRDNTP